MPAPEVISGAWKKPPLEPIARKQPEAARSSSHTPPFKK
jgi:hypothetical protein